jgi:MFS transporter, DHA1 family, tetracycline resistance protein
MQGNRNALIVLLVSVFINIAGFSLILPLLPFYGKELGASPIAVALLFSAYSFGNIFGEIYWGRLSDKIGRKRVMIGTMICAALSYVAFAYAPTLVTALIIRIVCGFFSGTLGVAQGYIADITPPEKRAQNMGYFGAAFNLGFAFGPAIGGLLAIQDAGLAGFRPPIFAAGGLAAAAAIWSAFALKETRELGGPVRAQPDFSAAFRFVGGDGLLTRLFLIAFFGIAAFASMEAVFGLWTNHQFGWSAREVGLTFIAVGSAGMLVQVFLLGPLVKRFGEARVIIGALCLLAAAMLLQPVFRNPVAAVILMSLLMVGHSLAFPNVGALVSRATPPETQGSVMGLMMASNALARIIAPPTFGLIYASVSPDAPYIFGAVMIAGAVFIAFQVKRIREQAA